MKYLKILSILVILVLTPVLINAQNYTVLQPLPGIGDVNGQTTVDDYIPAAFNLAVGLAVALAFIMIVVGGFTYSTSDAIAVKSKGKEMIFDALYGLLLVIGAYTILYTINPQLTNITLSIEQITSQSNPSVTVWNGTNLGQAELTDDTTIRSALTNAGITINNGPCIQGQTRGCTNVNGLPQTVITGLQQLRNQCNCPLMITGGTEGGHATHGPGRSIVDLRPNVNLNNFITGNAGTPYDGYSRTISLRNGQRITFTYETAGGNVRGTSTGNHWHIVIN